jgi:hypothetical protein
MNINLNNPTPFVPLHFESIDAKRNHFGVVVVRGSFEILNGKRLVLADEQEPLVMEDTYFGDRENSSLRFDSGLSPYKPKTDVLIEATAYAPNGIEAPEWISEVQFGETIKRFRVTGPRHWTAGAGFRPSAPEPISSLDVRYEYAFGGRSNNGTPHPRNPIGVGFNKSLGAKYPQIVPVEREHRSFEKTPVIGLGPICPSWESRRRFSGTYDEKWQQNDAPYLPADFDFEFYNVAPEDMRIAGFAKGDEGVKLTNLYSGGEMAFGLPNIQMGSAITLTDGRMIPGAMNLDTIEIQVEKLRVYLQWRGIFPASLPVKDVDLKISAPQYLVAS